MLIHSFVLFHSLQCLSFDTEPDSIWNTSKGYIDKLKQGIRSSWEDNDSNGMWIHHFMILQMIHPVFIQWNDPVTFQNNNNAAIIKARTNRDREKYISCFGEPPRYKYVWIGVVNDENKDNDGELDRDEE